MPAMIHSVNEAGELLSVSDAWLSKLGYSRDEVLGRRLTEFLTTESRERALKEVLLEFSRAGRCENLRYNMIKKDGGVIDVLLSAALAEDLLGQERISLAVVTDITALTETTRLLAEANRSLRALAAQDELTGLADRRAFEEALTSEYQRARRDDGPLAAIMIEVDGFEAFNERYGRLAGDNCLKLIAGGIGKTVRRAGDIAARYSGAAFAILLPGAQEAGGMSVALRIQQAMLRLVLEQKDNEHGVPTVSMGVAATWPATSTEVQETLVQDALRALSLAKIGGGNTIISASATDLTTAAAA
jgi:diguanylate cyclase (GGDEF)-like protein/PAS domain S-box-containing protein